MMLTLLLIESHDEESHVAHHFNCLDPGNAVVPLMMLLALCGGGANVIT